MPLPINAPHLPPWIPPQQNSQPGRGDINSTGIERSRQQASVSAEGTILPIVYGEDYVGPIISLVRATEQNLYLRCIWCLGEIEEIVEVVGDDGEPIEGMVARHYTGRLDQGVDPTLAAIIPGYTDRCVVPLGNEWFGVAYSVITIPASAGIGFPRLRARIKGMKVRDPRGIPWTPYAFSQRLESAVTRIATAFNGTAHVYNASKGTYNATVPILNSAVGTVFGVVNIATTGITHTIFDSGDGKFNVRVASDNKLEIEGFNSSGATVFYVKSTTAIPTSGTVAFVASWDVENGYGHLYLGREESASSLVASTSETINHEFGGLAVGGLFTGTSNRLDGKLASFGYVEGYYDLSLGENLNLFIDINGRMKNPSPTKAVWMPDGYGTGFTYSVEPATLSELPSGWTESTTPNPTNYAYQAYGGKGTYFKNDDPSYFISSSTTIQFISQRAYATITPIVGGVLVSTDYGDDVMTLDSDTPENIVIHTFGADDGFVIKGLEAQNEFVLNSIYVSPAPIDRSFKFYNLDDWSTLSGTPSIPDPGAGGVMANGVASIKTYEYLFLSGETVQYEFEVSGSFTGTLTVLSGAETIKEVTEAGHYTGYFESTGSGIRQVTISWNTTGDVTVKNMRIITNTINNVFTKTPSLMLADLIESRAYGLGGTVNDLSLLKTVQYNEEKLIGANDVRQNRHEVGVTMAQSQSVISWLETFRAYARCYIVPRGNEYYLVKDSVVDPPYESLTQSQMVSGTFNLQKKSIINLPNVIKVYYTNTTADPWTEDFVEAVSPSVLRGEEYRRESVLRMPGIQSRAMANRIAIERLNDSTRIDLTGTFTAFDVAYPIEVGDVIKITHPIGLTDKLVRVLSANPIDRGKIGISFSEYDEDVYSSVIIDEPPPPDFGGLTPFQVPAITNLTAVEDFYSTGLQTQTQLIIGWDAMAYPFLQYYVLEIYEDDIRIVSVRTPDHSYYLRNLKIESTYRIKVYAVSTAYVPGEASSVSVVAQGYLIPPDFSNGKIVAFEAGDSISAYVSVPAIDVDLWGYEWRYRDLLDGHYFPKTGPNLSSSDWSGTGVAHWSFGYRSMEFDCTNSTKSIHINLAGSGIVASKLYDVYIKIKKLEVGGTAAGVSISLPGDESAIAGGGTWWVGLDPQLYDINKPGLYVRRDWPGNVVADLYIVAYNSTGKLTEFEIEYIAFREAASDREQDWTTAKFIDRSPSTNTRVEQLHTGDYIVYCRALDNVRRPRNPYGQYSVDIICDEVQIFNDSGAFFRYEFVLADGITSSGVSRMDIPSETKWNFTPSPTSLSEEPGGEVYATEKYGWVAPQNADNETWNAIFTSNVDSYTSPIASYFASVLGTAQDRYWNHHPVDLGTVVRGKITYFLKVERFDFAYPPEYTLYYWNNFGDTPSTITNFNPFTETDFEARFIQLEVKWPSSMALPKGLILRGDDQKVRVTAYPRTETGITTTLGPDGSGDPQPVTVRLQNRYQAVLSASAWTNTSTPVQCYIDNFVFGDFYTTFDLVALDINGIPTIVDAQWEFNGV